MYRDGRILVGRDCPSNPEGGDITDRDFKLSIIMRPEIPSFARMLADTTGYFQPSQNTNPDDTVDIIGTQNLAAPLGSTEAETIFSVGGDFTDDMAQAVGEVLRGAIKDCECAAAQFCPALSATRLLAAMNSALKNQENM